MFSNNEKTASTITTGDHGLAGDAINKITTLISTGGPILSQSNNAATRISKYKDDLVKLEDRMSQLLNRYTKQFTAMDSLVGSMNSLQTSLKSQFDSMLNTK
jgi:flagellar hook-associated protein 2